MRLEIPDEDVGLSYDSPVEVSGTDRAYAYSVAVLAVTAALRYILDAGLIDKVVTILR